jgi:hypothetical protein
LQDFLGEIHSLHPNFGNGSGFPKIALAECSQSIKLLGDIATSIDQSTIGGGVDAN